MAHRRRRTNRLVRPLRILLLFKSVGRFGQVGWTVFFANVFANFLDRLGSDARGIGTHVGDQTDQALFAKFDAFVEALRDHHGALNAETQLARRVLLQLAGGERRRSVAAAFFLVDRADYPVSLFQRGANLFRVFAVRYFNLLFALAHKARVERRRFTGGEVRINRPIFSFLERLDLSFALDNQAQRNGLHAPSRKTTANFVPQQRRDLIPPQSVEHATSLLCVHQILIDRTRMFKSGLDRTLGNFVEGNALNSRRSFRPPLLRLLGFFRFASPREFPRQVERNRLALAIRVRRQIDRVRRGRQLFQLGHNFLFAGDDDVVRLEVVLDIHTQCALGQILHVAERGLDREALPQILLDGLRLGRRFDND